MGLIYRIRSNKGNKVYYGSTTSTLSHRFAAHRCAYLRPSEWECSSSILFKEYGIDDCIIEQVEEVADDLIKQRERHWISIDENCINIVKRPCVSEEEKKEKHIECATNWNRCNKERHNQISREWVERNKEKRKETCRLYYLKKKALAETLSQ